MNEKTDMLSDPFHGYNAMFSIIESQNQQMSEQVGSFKKKG
jgi:hypothetical protein